MTFGSASSVDATASFSAAGTYVLRLTASDSELSAFDELSVDVAPAGTSQILDIPVATSSDDAEQRPTGGMSHSSSDLELVDDGNNNQTVGLRFTALNIPRNSAISNAYIQFQVDEATTAATSLTVHGQAGDNPATFTSTNGGMNARPGCPGVTRELPRDPPLRAGSGDVSCRSGRGPRGRPKRGTRHPGRC